MPDVCLWKWASEGLQLCCFCELVEGVTGNPTDSGDTVSGWCGS